MTEFEENIAADDGNLNDTRRHDGYCMTMKNI